MIAPAMKTRQAEALRYVQLARQGARIERSFAGDDLPRWAQLAYGEWSVQAAFEFYRDADALSWVKGEYQARAELLCTRCSEVLEHAFTGQVNVCIVGTDAQANELAGDYDVLVARPDADLMADIVEDELLLAVPEWLCVADECERGLPHDYPAAGKVQVEPSLRSQQLDRKNPFDVLARLKQQHE